MLLYSPLSQFQIIPIIKIQLFFIDISFTNMLLINILSLVCFLNFLYMNSLYVKKTKEFSSFFIANSWQKIVEFVPEVSIQIISDTITKNKEQYFPIIAVILNFILFSNIIGLIPYSFTTTSHLVITFTLSFSVFIGINIITIEKYKMEMFSLFLPSKSKFFLSLLLVPIELISYIAKPISLGVRLFINLMAGHSLLKVIVGFSWNMLLLENFISLGLIVPLIILVILYGLELGVALIQTYVFIILTCIYIQEGT